MARHPKKKRARERPLRPAPSGRRRWTMAILAGAAVLAVAWLAFRGRAVHSGVPDVERSPDQNILLITIDTLRADALGSSGGRATTPNLDRLAAEGIRYDFAHAHSVVTLPAHASILTGLYPFEHGVRDNSGYRLDQATPTLAAMLKSKGFATAAFVAAFPLDSRFGLNRGFDVYDEQFGSRTGASDFAIPERRASAVVAAATAWVDAQRSKWFAWVHLYDPHAPYQPPPPFDRQYADNTYAGEVAYTDSALGSLLDRARASERPSLVVVTGDHGEALGDHGERTHGLFAYEPTLRIPFTIAQLGRTAPRQPGGVSHDLVRHIDIVPTVLDALGLEPRKGLGGSSLLAADSLAANRTSYFEALSPSLNRGWAPLRGVIVGRQKYIQLPIEELYDLALDPAERQNLARDERESVRALAERLNQFGNTDATAGRRPENVDVAARLRALGYVSGSVEAKPQYTEDDDPKRLVHIDAKIARGIELYELGRPREAAALYREIIEERRDMPLAYLHLAFLQWELGAAPEAIDTLKTALGRGVQSLEIRTRLGTYLAETGDPREAIVLLEDALSSDSPDVDALNAVGIAYARAEQPSRALATFQRILTIDPRNAMAHENIGSVRLQLGELDGAREAFEAALARDSKSGRAHGGLAVVALRRGNREQAIALWKRALSVDPQDYESLYNVGQELARAGRIDEARPYLERFVRTAPPALFAADIARVRAALARR